MSMGRGLPVNNGCGNDGTSANFNAQKTGTNKANDGGTNNFECPSSTAALTTALAARRIDPYVYSSPPSALMAFDAFEKQINQHHIRSNR